MKVFLILFGLTLFLQLTAAAAAGSPKFHFVLVHGAGHGAWCWYKITKLLTKAGHKVDAVDLLSAGDNSADARTVASLHNYSLPLIQKLTHLPDHEKVILIGHSLGGLTLTYAVEKLPSRIAAAVYLTAFMLPSTSQANSIFQEVNVPLLQGKYIMPAIQFNGSTTAFAVNLDRVQGLFYQLSPKKDVALAKLRLKPFPSLDPLVNYTSTRFGSVPRYFIKTLKDRVILPKVQDQMINMTPPRAVLHIDSDHSPFFSKPNDLVSQLLQIARARKIVYKKLN